MGPHEYIPAPDGDNAAVSPFPGYDSTSTWDLERLSWYKVRLQWAREAQRVRHGGVAVGRPASASAAIRVVCRPGSGSTMAPIPEGIEPPVTEPLAGH